MYNKENQSVERGQPNITLHVHSPALPVSSYSELQGPKIYQRSAVANGEGSMAIRLLGQEDTIDQPISVLPPGAECYQNSSVVHGRQAMALTTSSKSEELPANLTQFLPELSRLSEQVTHSECDDLDEKDTQKMIGTNLTSMKNQQGAQGIGNHAKAIVGNYIEQVHFAVSTEKVPVDWTFLKYPYNPNFQKRSTLWSAMETHFESSSVVSFLVLAGLGGMGKTSLAAQWAQEQERIGRYEAIRWMSMEPESIEGSLESLAKKCDILIDKKNRMGWLDELHHFLKKHTWLIIWDNVNDYDAIQDMLPYFSAIKEKQHLLITSRDDYWSNAITVDSYTEDEAIHYIQHQMALAKMLGFKAKEALELSEHLGHHPLALELAMANICLYQTPLHIFLGTLKSQGIISQPWPRKKLDYQARLNENTLPTLWLLGSQVLSEDALSLLRFISFMNPDGIRLEYLLNFFEGNQSCCQEAILLLRTQSLIRQDVTGKWRVHRLLQAVACHEAKTVLCSDAMALNIFQEKIFKALKKTFFTFSDTASLDIVALQEGLLHGKSWLSHESSIPFSTNQPDFLYNLAQGEILLAHYEVAKSYLQQALSEYHQHYGVITNRPDIAAILHQLGIVSYREGNYTEARTYYAQAITMKEAIYGVNMNHLDIAATLHELGRVYSIQGCYSEALVTTQECV